MFFRLLLLLMGASLLSGCMVGPDHRTPSTEIPPAWRHAAENIRQDSSDITVWWLALNDPILNGLMDEALAGNLTLAEASLRIAEARGLRCVVRGDLFPQFDGDASYMFQKTATSGGLVGQLGGGGGGAGGFQFDDTTDQYTLGLNGSWEIDIFGRLRRNVQAANAEFCAAVWAYRDTKVLMLAEIATNYLDVRTFQQRLEIAQKNLKSQERSLEITEKRFKAGLTSELDVAQAKANAESTRSEIPAIEADYQQSVNRLSLLIGKTPGSVDDILAEVTTIPKPPKGIAIGMPAELLRRRPDVQQAEFILAAQVARIGVAEADLYPQLSLTGSFGVNSQDLDNLFTTESIAANIGPTFRWNLLNFGRVRCNIDVQDARAAQYVASYRNTVLKAAEEVDNALIHYTRELQRQTALEEAVKASRRAVELSQAQYTQGTIDFQRVLDSQRQLLQFENQLAVNRGSITRYLVELYRALGGGWEYQGNVLGQNEQEFLVLPNATLSKEALVVPDEQHEELVELKKSTS